MTNPRDELMALAPCPFCHGAAYLHEQEGQRPEDTRYSVHCDECDATHDAPSKDAAVAAWNRRTAASRPAPQVVDSEAVADLVFWYRNYKGEERYRHARPISIRFDATEWHHTPQWLMRAIDLEKNEEREFAMKDMRHIMPQDTILSLLRSAEPCVDCEGSGVNNHHQLWPGRAPCRYCNGSGTQPPTTDDVGEPVAWDHRVLCACENCTEHAPENSVFAREDIGVMPDGTWLCENCYSDCEKTAYGMVANDSDDFEYPRFEDLPRPSLYTHPPKSPDTSAAVLQSHALKQALDCLSEIAAAHIPDCPAHYAGDELSWAQRHVGSLRHKAEIARDGIAAAIRQLPTTERGDK